MNSTQDYEAVSEECVMSNQTKVNVQQLTIHALLIAIICVISFLPIKTLGLEITLSMVPVAIGATLYGAKTGALLGGVFGAVSFLQCLGFSPFGAALLAIDPLLTLVVCLPSRMLAGFLAGLAASAVKKAGAQTLSRLAGAVIAPILNTVFFMGTLCLCFYNTELIQGFCQTLGATNPLTFILLFVGINGLVEIIAGIVLAIPLTNVIAKITKR